MSEVTAWIVVIGLATAVAALSMLHVRIARETRSALDAVLYRVMARLCGNGALPSGRKRPAPEAGGASTSERRVSPRRRLDDLFPSHKLRRAGL